MDELFRQVRKGAIGPVYHLQGDEDILKDELIQEIVNGVLDPSMRAFNLDQPDVAGLDAERLHALLNTPPMLAERRVVVLRGVQQLRKKSRARDALFSYLAAPSAGTVLVTVEPAGDSQAERSRGTWADDLPPTVTVVTLDRLPPDRVRRWIGHRAETLGLELDEHATAHLADALSGDLGLIARELDKLAATIVGRPATRGDVETLIGIRHGETLHDLVAAALERRAADAARLVEPVLAQSGISGVRIVMALGTALLGTALARAELDRGSPATRAEGAVFQRMLTARPAMLPGRWKDVAAQWVRWARHWRAAELRHAMRAALLADQTLKGSRVSSDAGIVSDLVLGWAVPAREAA